MQPVCHNIVRSRMCERCLRERSPSQSGEISKYSCKPRIISCLSYMWLSGNGQCHKQAINKQCGHHVAEASLTESMRKCKRRRKRVPSWRIGLPLVRTTHVSRPANTIAFSCKVKTERSCCSEE